MEVRLKQHRENKDNTFAFTLKYNCYYRVYFEHFPYIEHAIEREKEIKGWTRAKKNALIEVENKNWDFLNDSITEE